MPTTSTFDLGGASDHAVSGYLGAYPHLNLAREFGLPYGAVLAIGELLRKGHMPERTEDCDPRYARHFETFSDLPAQRKFTLGMCIGEALRQFSEQQAGTRGMDGKIT